MISATSSGSRHFQVFRYQIFGARGQRGDGNPGPGSIDQFRNGAVAAHPDDHAQSPGGLQLGGPVVVLVETSNDFGFEAMPLERCQQAHDALSIRAFPCFRIGKYQYAVLIRRQAGNASKTHGNALLGRDVLDMRQKRPAGPICRGEAPACLTLP